LVRWIKARGPGLIGVDLPGLIDKDELPEEVAQNIARRRKKAGLTLRQLLPITRLFSFPSPVAGRAGSSHFARWFE